MRKFSKSGGMMQALTDFSKVSRKEVKEYSLPNGVSTYIFVRTINDAVREKTIWVPTSSDTNRPVQSQKQARS